MHFTGSKCCVQITQTAGQWQNDGRNVGQTSLHQNYAQDLCTLSVQRSPPIRCLAQCSPVITCQAAPATPGPMRNEPHQERWSTSSGMLNRAMVSGLVAVKPYTTLTCTLCQALLRTPRRFQMGAGDSGCVLYAPSTALHTSFRGPSKPSGSGRVAFHSVHAHALQEYQGFEGYKAQHAAMHC